MNLRPYQQKACNHALNMLAARRNSLIVAGTGAGKTIMMAAVIGDFFRGFWAAHRRRPHILVLVHRNEIHTQNRDKFALVNPDIATSEITAARKSLRGFVHFGMVQTVANIFEQLIRSQSFFDMIVIDEAHHAAASTYKDIINANQLGNPNAVLLGVTATPNRGDKLPLVDLFDNYYQITTKFLIDSHYLVRPTFIDLTPTFRKEQGTELGHLAKNIKCDIEGDTLINQLVNDYLEKKLPGKSVIFAPDHEFCQRILKALSAHGRKAAYLGPSIDDLTRKSQVELFEKGDYDELVNVDICTEGYDYPPLLNLVDFDTNGTHGQWVQKVGRVLRTSEGKHKCCVIDFGGNVQLYPDGVESDVNLEGKFKCSKGQRLTNDDFSKTHKDSDEIHTSTVLDFEQKVHTPYHLPEGFETVNDSDLGVVIVACCPDGDCIIAPQGEHYHLFVGDKEAIALKYSGELQQCIEEGKRYLGPSRYKNANRSISNLQIKLLAPEYPTTALNWSGANCCICFKLWKDDVLNLLRGGGAN